MEAFLDKICQVIQDKKGFNVLVLDVRGISSVTDWLVIAEGNVDRHVSAIAAAVADEKKPLRFEGLQGGDWALLDYAEVMVHIFLPATREKFRLEELWSLQRK